MTGCRAVNARTLSATATAATVPAEIFRTVGVKKTSVFTSLLKKQK